MRSLVLAMALLALLPDVPPDGGEVVIQVTAQRFVFTPNRIVITKGVPTVIELTSKDRTHGFMVSGLKIREQIKPGETTRVRITADKVGTFPFHCFIFCGKGHEDMAGEIVVIEK